MKLIGGSKCHASQCHSLNTATHHMTYMFAAVICSTTCLTKLQLVEVGLYITNLFNKRVQWNVIFEVRLCGQQILQEACQSCVQMPPNEQFFSKCLNGKKSLKAKLSVISNALCVAIMFIRPIICGRSVYTPNHHVWP